MADELGLDELRAHALTTIGMAKNARDDLSGTADMERGLELALGIDSPVAAAIVNNLAVEALYAGDLRRTEELYAEAMRLAERFGDRAMIRFIGGNQVWIDFMRGRWSQAFENADAFVAECEAGSPHINEFAVRLVRGSIRDGRGDAEGGLTDHVLSVELARELGNPRSLLGALCICAATHAERGDLDAASTLAWELIPLIREYGLNGAISAVIPFAAELGVADELRTAVEEAAGRRTRWRQLLLRALDGDYRGATEIAAEMGSPTLEARHHLHAGKELLAGGFWAESQAGFEQALAFYRSVDATYWVEKSENLLAQAQRASA
jgi:hypothetical protein